MLVDPKGNSRKNSISERSTQRATMAADHYRNNPPGPFYELHLFGNTSWILLIESKNR